jgi:hypothetical protein
MSKTDELISKLEEGKNPEPLKHAIERLKKDAIRSQIGYIFPNEHYIECSGIIMACDQILEWIDSEISSLKEQIKKEETLPNDIADINFIKWYSGMDEQKIRNAFKRYKNEVLSSAPDIKKGKEDKRELLSLFYVYLVGRGKFIETNPFDSYKDADNFLKTM